MMVSSLSTTVLKCELYWDMRWALGWVSLGEDGRLGNGCDWVTELLFTILLVLFLADLIDLE